MTFLRRVLWGALGAIFACAPICVHAATLLPNGKQQFLDANGHPLVAGQVFFYIPGTTTPKSTWQDSGETTLNSNPVILDSSGSAVIYGTGSYRERVLDAAGNLVYDQLTADTSSTDLVWGGTSGGTANAQTVVANNFTSADGQTLGFRAGFTNTSALTLNVNGAGPISVVKDASTGPEGLTGSEVVAGGVYLVIYDATLGEFHLVNGSQSPYFGAPTSIAAAATVDLGTSLLHNVTITGNAAPVTSFGSSASTATPIYFLTFSESSGAQATLANSSAISLPGAQNLLMNNGDTALAVYQGSGNWVVTSVFRAASQSPNVQVFGGAGSITYTTPTGATRLEVREVGAGGGAGGCGSSASGGGDGGGTTFAGVTASGGHGGGGVAASASGGNFGAGGSGGSGSAALRVAGNPGSPGMSQMSSSAPSTSGVNGGASFFGGAGAGGAPAAGGNNATGPGSGGGGPATISGVGSGIGGGGSGGAGEYVEFTITNPAASYAGTVGGGGSAGTGASLGGGAGHDGLVEVTAYFN